ncbi:MAG TPA: HAMP domain-containing sensor histidine kinase [Microthrixaceae bacterium]|nr:HAMP domain-containing sensor histidine kinase [Microthrixaceae bacterium]
MLIAVAVAASVTGVVVVATVRSLLVDQLDDQLSAAADPIGQMVRGDTLMPAIPSGSATMAVPEVLSDLWIAVVSTDGSVRYQFPSEIGDVGAPDLASLDLERSEPSDAFEVGGTDGGSSYRVLVRDAGENEHLVIAAPVDATDRAVGRLVLALAMGALATVGVVAVMGWWVLRHGIAPIRNMTRAAESIASGDSDRRVDVPPGRTEAAELARAINAVLDERRRTEERLRRFVADASHELRTPLTSIRGYSDLHRADARAHTPELADALDRIHRESLRMAALVDQLLTLARHDHEPSVVVGPVAVARAVREIAGDAEVAVPGRQVLVEVDDQPVALASESGLRRVIRGLVDNALRYTSGVVRLTARQDADEVVITVSDDGPGMDADIVEHAFDRFFRGDPARSRRLGGSGLGLAIARSEIARQGGTITLRSHPERGTDVEVRLPRRYPTRVT